MKILVVSDRYPPYYSGGYDLGCKDAVDGLIERQHDVRVLTSMHGVDGPRVEGNVYRWLIDSEATPRETFRALLHKEQTNQRAFVHLVNAFEPDIVYFWKLNRVSVSLAFIAQEMDLRVSYYVFDRWITLWKSDPWYHLWHRKSRRLYVQAAKGLLRHVIKAARPVTQHDQLDFRRAQLCSYYLKDYAREAGALVNGADVIHWGVNPGLFTFSANGHHRPQRLLYVGRVVPHKGVHTIIDALHELVNQRGYTSLSLTIVGSDPSEYVSAIHETVEKYGLTDHVRFVSFVDREALPGLYQEHDILIFPSVWEEPFGLTALEGMASGLVLVSTATGGAAEVVEHSVTGLTFEKEDPAACADQIAALVDDPAWYEQLRRAGRASVEQRFNLTRAIDEVERSLQKAVQA